jgi:hypothetical protein
MSRRGRARPRENTTLRIRLSTRRTAGNFALPPRTYREAMVISASPRAAHRSRTKIGRCERSASMVRI